MRANTTLLKQENCIMKNFKHQLIIAGLIIGMSSSAYAADNTVTVDSTTGAWIFQFTDTIDGEYKKLTFIPPTLIEPTMQSSVAWNGKEFVYRYYLRNGKNAKQDISKIYVRRAPVNLFTRVQPKEISSEEMQDAVKNSSYIQSYSAWGDEQNVDAIKRIQGIYEWKPKIKYMADSMNYGWFSAFQDESTGVKPGHTQNNMRLTVPNLPGALMARIEGDTPSEPLPAGMPRDESDFRTKVKALLATIGLQTPVLGPAITIPSPYNGAELARRIKTHVQTWTANELITPFALASINRELDVLIPALERGDKAGVRGSSIALWQQLFTYHRDLNHDKFNNDDEQHESHPKRHVSIARDGAVTVNNQAIMQEPINRVAARALGYNLMYLLTRSEIGR
jgi:hypothetical protein